MKNYINSELKKIVYDVISWCEIEYGYSKFQNFLVDFELDNEELENEKEYFYQILAEYDDDDNLIIVYYKKIRKTTDLIKSIIHEYQHYLQSPSWYSIYDRKYGYYNNPYEKRAEEIAERDFKTCYKKIKK
jgi:hypothetical protein